MRIVVLALGSLLASMTSMAEDLVRFGIVTTSGYVQFATPPEWVVIGAKTKQPISVMAFQVKNAADEGTPDSTNVAVMLYDTSDSSAQKASETIGRQRGAGPVTSSERDGWQIFNQEPIQHGVTYVLIDAKRSVADVVVGIRCAWPRLPANPSNYDETMINACQALISSVSGGLGSPPPQVGQQIYRQMK